MIPVLQRQDGTFVGTAWIGEYYDEWFQMTKSMAAFDAGGNVLWSVANEQPMIATEDGGVIGRSGTTRMDRRAAVRNGNVVQSG
jgi:hypothetical protein